MIKHNEITDSELRIILKEKKVSYGGNLKLKIYGRLDCKSGKRMKKENRVFFLSQIAAINQGFRPCGHCLFNDYKIWKNENNR